MEQYATMIDHLHTSTFEMHCLPSADDSHVQPEYPWLDIVPDNNENVSLDKQLCKLPPESRKKVGISSIDAQKTSKMVFQACHIVRLCMNRRNLHFFFAVWEVFMNLSVHQNKNFAPKHILSLEKKDEAGAGTRIMLLLLSQ